jgi:hypothetical protein
MVVDSTRFGAAVALGRDRLRAALADAAPDVELSGDEPVTTLAALVVSHDVGSPPDLTTVGAPRTESYFGQPDGTVTRGLVPGSGRRLIPAREWSPDGFGWGHHDETARELAFALVADASGSPQAGRQLAGRCVDDIVARIPAGRPWTVPVEQVRTWATTHSGQQLAHTASSPVASVPEAGL